MKRIQDYNPTTDELLDLKYNYQEELTQKLDNISGEFNQELINEIVLWKVNRYALLNERAMALINKVDEKSNRLDDSFTGEILMALLDTKGIRLPMASSILRFKNPNLYQIIDQRVYRIIYGEELKLKTNHNASINQYLDYLSALRNVCDLYQIPFSQSDRILYEYDKMINLEKIKY